MAPCAKKKLKQDLNKITQTIWCPNIEGIDPSLLIDNYETGIENQEIDISVFKKNIFFQTKNIKSSGIFYSKVSDIFPNLNGEYFLHVSFLSYGHSYLNIFYNHKTSLGDQVHAHDTNWTIKNKLLIPNEKKRSGNTRKFFYINNHKYDCNHYLVLNINKVENIETFNLNLRFLSDTGDEKINQIKINFKEPLLIINVEEEIKKFDRFCYKNAIIQIESLDDNINGSMIYISKNGLAADHLSGG